MLSRNQRQLLRFIVVAAACTLPGGALCAQNAAATPAGSFGKIAGVVRDENGTAIESTVFIASNGLRLHATTAPDGSFEFSNLKTGKYTICARATGRNAKPQDEPFVDSCLWQDRNALKVTLAPGQNQSGVTVPLKRGYLLKIRINDPGGQIPIPVGKVAGNHLSLNLVAFSGLMQQVPLLSQDASGRDHGIVIPYDTLHKLIIHSSTLVLKDGNGRDVGEATALEVKVSRAIVPQPIIGAEGEFVRQLD